MHPKTVEVRWNGPHERPWRIYWAGTDDLASEERFATLEDAGEAMRELMARDIPPQISADG